MNDKDDTAAKIVVGTIIVLIILAIAAAILGLLALVLMLSANLVLSYYDQKPLTYPVSFGIVVVLSIVGNFFRSTVSKSEK